MNHVRELPGQSYGPIPADANFGLVAAAIGTEHGGCGGPAANPALRAPAPVIAHDRRPYPLHETVRVHDAPAAQSAAPGWHDLTRYVKAQILFNALTSLPRVSGRETPEPGPPSVAGPAFAPITG